MEILNTIISILPVIFVLAIFVVAGILYLKGQKNKAQDWLSWVDSAIQIMDSYIETNPAIADVIVGDKE